MNLESLMNTVKNIDIYQVKDVARKVQNVVMNYTEMEAKVREATNGDPWGASSTLMNEISAGTYNYTYFNEIMPMIYKRFTDKSAEEWRQIYKALVLLEFLVKHGSERVVDDARSHISMIKMLKNFHYVDEKAKDQGINVRNRAKELSELLSDVDSIRQERRKAKATKNKYTGVGNDRLGGIEGSAGFGDSSSRYGGFSSDRYFGGGYSEGAAGTSSSTYKDDGRRNTKQFEEYDEYDDGGVKSVATRSPTTTRRTSKPTRPEVDLFSFEDEGPAKTTTSGDFQGQKATNRDDDDEFDEFQSAPLPASQVQFPPSQIQSFTVPASLGSLNVASFRASQLIQPSSTVYTSPALSFPAQKTSTFTQPPAFAQSGFTAPRQQPQRTPLTKSTPLQSKPNDAFGDLWSTAAGKKKECAPTVSMATMAKNQASEGIWEMASTCSSTANNASSSALPAEKPSGATGDLLF
ncbi:ENTH domain-containing protein [Neolecta irregularis DAH-3]|uniref:ENTH domain-containing protein n=1 Tax=Neolecta irregularis (strain DAH-3) TaxID=1198029 RepID=A0A1U7LLJ1_NEOID|nr:ENTH domain-containing protein [Neolecta irregularis DAH-3]|eukprot:OLL23517.1 ENTH domain-containing protein [Neolecta irregularis DAH-3]